jgi:uncharacterized LabA/DUF88 family protein
MTTNFYIDGFNLYNGSVKKTQYKWLDISALCQHLFPNCTVNKIRYFTSIVLRFQHNWGAPDRQDVYLRALRTLPNVIIHRDGWFAKHAVLWPIFPIVYDAKNRMKLVRVLKLEEKRTDVDLATWLLIDCFENDFDDAVVISNDSDLVPAIDAVNNRYGRPVWMVNPHFHSKPHRHLVAASSGHHTGINRSALAACQLPTTLSDSAGQITKPATW